MFPPIRLLHTRLLVRSRITLARGMSSGASQQQGASASTGTPTPTGSRDDLFYDPSITLSRRQREVFTRVEDVPPAPPMDDHGFLYGLKGSDVSALSDAVKRALSTRTGSLEDLKQFKTAQMIERLGGNARNSGASRVQGAWRRWTPSDPGWLAALLSPPAILLSVHLPPPTPSFFIPVNPPFHPHAQSR